MLVKTKYFGEVELSEEKILTFDQGILGFENIKKYTIIYDEEEGKESYISWLQSIEMAELAIPVIMPFLIKSDYNPVIEDELLKNLGTITEDNTIILLTLTVPSDIANISVNLKAPIIINTETQKGCQVIAENQDYSVKYKVYDIIQKLKNEKGEV